MSVGADVVIFSGSLNLLSSRQFYRSIRDGWAATRGWLAFNFLCSPELADAPWLTWHRPASVLAFAAAPGGGGAPRRRRLRARGLHGRAAPAADA